MEENHGCDNCPHERGWCEMPDMKRECARKLAAKCRELEAERDAAIARAEDLSSWKLVAEGAMEDVNKYRTRAEALLGALKASSIRICRYCTERGSVDCPGWAGLCSHFNFDECCYGNLNVGTKATETAAPSNHSHGDGAFPAGGGQCE